MEAKKAKAQLNEAAAGKSNDGEGMNANKQGDSQAATYTEVDPFTGSPKGEDSSLKKGPAEGQVKQGDSQDASYTEQDPHNAAANSPDTSLRKGNSEPQAKQGDSRDAQYGEGSGRGHNGSFEKPVAPGNGVKAFEDTEVDGDAITETDLDGTDATLDAQPRKVEMNLEDLRKDIASVFAADANLSEEFKTQASKIFEAAVIARVNNEVETLTAELQEQNAAEFEALKEGLVEKVDSYLNYVVEQWMTENEIAVEQGLRTEVAEDFMLGLKNLFQEHYFEVPENRIDVLEDMATKVDAAESKLDEAIQANIELKAQLEQIQRTQVIEQACKDLTATDAEKMSKLLEGVEFDNLQLFTEKVSVIKENYFPGNNPASPEKMLEEQVQNQGDKLEEQVVPANMKAYAAAIGRTAKFNK